MAGCKELPSLQVTASLETRDLFFSFWGEEDMRNFFLVIEVVMNLSHSLKSNMTDFAF